MKRKAYWEMNREELAAATKQFDQQDIADQSRALTAAERKQWQQAKRKRGRPKIGQGHQRISLSIERALLRKINGLAKRRRLSRSRLFAQVLQEALAQEANRDRAS